VTIRGAENETHQPPVLLPLWGLLSVGRLKSGDLDKLAGSLSRTSRKLHRRQP